MVEAYIYDCLLFSEAFIAVGEWMGGLPVFGICLKEGRTRYDIPLLEEGSEVQLLACRGSVQAACVEYTIQYRRS